MHLPPVPKFRRLAPASPSQLETEVLEDVIDLDNPIIDTGRIGVVSATATPHFGWSHLRLGREPGVMARLEALSADALGHC